MDASLCQSDIKEPVYDGIFSYYPLLKTNSNKEHDNANIPPFPPESIEQIVEQIFHSVPV